MSKPIDDYQKAVKVLTEIKPRMQPDDYRRIVQLIAEGFERRFSTFSAPKFRLACGIDDRKVRHICPRCMNERPCSCPAGEAR